MTPSDAKLSVIAPLSSVKNVHGQDANVTMANSSPPSIRNHVNMAPTQPAQSRTTHKWVQADRGSGMPLRRQTRLRFTIDMASWYTVPLFRSTSACRPPTVRTVTRIGRLTAPPDELSLGSGISSISFLATRHNISVTNRRHILSLCLTASPATVKIPQNHGRFFR